MFKGLLWIVNVDMKCYWVLGLRCGVEGLDVICSLRCD